MWSLPALITLHKPSCRRAGDSVTPFTSQLWKVIPRIVESQRKFGPAAASEDRRGEVGRRGELHLSSGVATDSWATASLSTH